MPELHALDSLRAAANQHPWLKSALKTLANPIRSRVSRDYVELPEEARAGSLRELKNAWQAPEIPARQRIGVERELAAYRAGMRIPSIDSLVEMVAALRSTQERLSLLEVGCSSGYHSEALAIKGVDVDYAGCDYSEGFIELARRYYPALDFRVEDATALQYPDASFDIVLSGCCLLHIPDYEAAIREAARVTRRHVIFHRTPVLHRAPTRYFTKSAYGVKTVEIHFNERELVSLFARHRLSVIDIETLDASWHRGDAYATKSYLCQRLGDA